MWLFAKVRFGIIVMEEFCQNTNADSNALNARKLRPSKLGIVNFMQIVCIFC